MNQLSVDSLRCEYFDNPIGIDRLKPLLSWKLVSDARNVNQAAYKIMAASSARKLEDGDFDLWDSGKVSSGDCVAVEYNGVPLGARVQVFWRVEVWDNYDNHATSSVATWEMGLLGKLDWSSSWIRSWLAGAPRTSVPSPLFRKPFHVEGRVERARLYVTALGLHECWINGHKVSEDRLAPGWTDYRVRAQYQSYNVTELVKQGENTLGAMLGDGWFCGYVGWRERQFFGEQPALLAQLEITTEDGTRHTVGTDGTWTFALGPILSADILMGESYDARKELENWCSPGKPAGSWVPVEIAPEPGIVVNAQIGPTVRVIEELKPLDAPRNVHGRWIYNMGQNMVGVVRLHLKNQPRGATIGIRHAEMLNEDGSLYTTNLRGALQTDYYTTRGDEAETYEPRFTFHGFQYVELSGFHGTPDIDTITAVTLHSAMNITGSFECSDKLVNQLQHNILWGQKGNFVDVPTDCPQRDERLGWMGDAQVFIRTAAFNMDVAGFFNRWMLTVEDSQGDHGEYPMFAPNIDSHNSDGGPAWSDAGIICPWTIYLCYGDKRILRDRYASMQRYMQWLTETAVDFIRCSKEGKHYHCFGDWLNIEAGTPNDLLGTAFYAYCLELMQRIASVLGHEADAAAYGSEWVKVRDAYVAHFLAGDDPEALKSQTGCILSLHFNLVQDELKARVTGALVSDITSRKDHISSGFVGAPYVQQVLTSSNETAVAYKLLAQTSWPSWLYSVTRGATTIWERWDGWTEEKGFQDPGMNSFNHYAYGAVGDWLYTTVAGIDTDSASPGYRRIVMAPKPGGSLTYATAELNTMYGLVSSSWRLDDDRFIWNVKIPANTSAVLFPPCCNVRIDGEPAASKSAGGAAGSVLLGSGSYEVTGTLLQ